MMIKPGEEILFGAGRRFRVVAVIPFEEEDESPDTKSRETYVCTCWPAEPPLEPGAGS
jgi:hypothetical protein